MNALLMPFLYFPEDKSEYIPAAISFVIFMILLVFAFRWIRNNSKKQELETKELEERILRERREAKEKQHPQN
ncbi:putative membrane protein [Sporosarcina sp. JAI121]|nr:putative membrane protein [Sporosarcina sp. JAI121]